MSMQISRHHRIIIVFVAEKSFLSLVQQHRMNVRDTLMDVAEAMDREVVIERAEAVRFWLLGMPLSHRATSAIQRELGAIIANDPGGYINGQRPLAGLTVSEFVDELNRPNGGAVGRVKRVSESILNELRAAISAAAATYRRQAAPAAPVVEESPAQRDAPAAQPARRRGRPKGSTKAAMAARSNAVAAEVPPAPAAAQPSPQQADEPRIAEQPEPAAPKRGRGRPRRVVAPTPADAPAHGGASAPIAPASPAPPLPTAEGHAAPAERAYDDPLLGQISRLWPSLHPHARRALVMYASTLWAEGGFEG
ncbi:hypothetical protein K2Z83_18180 [Oscillochloris sp. ZM17-4]|uniref:hypothetical protein n=1 Tax=Oscillochloris sp. ZM17-4 TaxID=2866714 RepID=UPI001C730423|nr:hypothetical protein [Oscillochloris sp. ZM17-4]MBX0329601.1 hypothetical protein [Oscillochloris sp. ZM17-4]